MRKFLKGTAIFFLGALMLAGVQDYSKTKAPADIAVLIIFLVLIVLLIKNFNKGPREKKENVTKITPPPMLLLKHIEGLPVADGTDCTLILEEDKIKIKNSGYEFNIALDKITTLAMKSDVEIQNIVKQSGTGMVVGAVTFGLLGAMVGGRAKTKEKRVMHHFFIINYMTNNECKYIVFSAFPSMLINKFIKTFNQKTGDRLPISLDL